jgi:hypothetical protein
MATARTESPVLHDNNLETCSIVWLDPSGTEIKDHVETQKRLRKLINHVTTFRDVDVCEQHIRFVSKEDRIILVINGQLAREMVPRIHSLRQVSSIYVYDMEKKRNEEWTKKFQKVNEQVF